MEEHREENRELMEEEAGKGTLDDVPQRDNGNSVSDDDVGSGDESSEKTLSTGEGDDDVERVKLVEVETNDETAESEAKSQNGEEEIEEGKCSESVPVLEESTQLSQGERNEKNPGNESADDVCHGDEIINQKEENGEAMEIDYAAEEEVDKDCVTGNDASVVQTQDASIAEPDENDASVVNEMEIDERKVKDDIASIGADDSANPRSPSGDAAGGEAEPGDHNLFDPSADITNFIDFSGVSTWSGNIQDVKIETGNVPLKEEKKATDVADEVDTSVNAEGIENESTEARGDESPAAATREASDAVMGSDENQEDKETIDQQVGTREEDDITHEAPSIDPDQKEDAEMEENPNNSDDGTDSEIKANGVKRKADVLSDDSAVEGRKTVSLAKVSFTPASFKIGASIARAASQMAGAPSVLKACTMGDKNLSVESFVSQLHRAATDPDKENVVSELAADFFVGFRNSTASQEFALEKVTKKRGRPSKSKVGGTEAFEFEEMGDTYWTDRVIHNGGEEETPPTEKGNYQVVPVELKPAQVKKTRRPYRRRQSQIILPLPQASDKPAGYDENAPAELIMNFSETDTIPPEKSLSKMFRHFGPIRESQTEVDEEKNRARVVFRKGADADVAYNSAKSFNIFGTKAVNYELSFTITETFKVQPYIVSLAEEDAALSLPS